MPSYLRITTMTLLETLISNLLRMAVAMLR